MRFSALLCQGNNQKASYLLFILLKRTVWWTKKLLRSSKIIVSIGTAMCSLKMREEIFIQRWPKSSKTMNKLKKCFHSHNKNRISFLMVSKIKLKQRILLSLSITNIICSNKSKFTLSSTKWQLTPILLMEKFISEPKMFNKLCKFFIKLDLTPKLQWADWPKKPLINYQHTIVWTISKCLLNKLQILMVFLGTNKLILHFLHLLLSLSYLVLCLVTLLMALFYFVLGCSYSINLPIAQILWLGLFFLIGT